MIPYCLINKLFRLAIIQRGKMSKYYLQINPYNSQKAVVCKKGLFFTYYIYQHFDDNSRWYRFSTKHDIKWMSLKGAQTVKRMVEDDYDAYFSGNRDFISKYYPEIDTEKYYNTKESPLKEYESPSLITLKKKTPYLPSVTKKLK